MGNDLGIRERVFWEKKWLRRRKYYKCRIHLMPHVGQMYVKLIEPYYIVYNSIQKITQAEFAYKRLCGVEVLHETN